MLVFDPELRSIPFLWPILSFIWLNCRLRCSTQIAMLEYVELIGHSMTYIMKALCLMGSKIVMDGDIFKCSLIKILRNY